MSIQALRDNLAHAREQKYEFIIGLQADEVEAALAELEAQLAEARKDAIYLSSSESRTHFEALECPTYYDGCHCTVATLEITIQQVRQAEAQLAEANRERDKTIEQCNGHFDKWQDETKKAEACESRLRVALEIYAKPENWYRTKTDDECRQYFDIYEEDGRTLDGWIIAQDALDMKKPPVTIGDLLVWAGEATPEEIQQFKPGESLNEYRKRQAQAATAQPDCGHPFRVGDVCPSCGAADAGGKE